MLRKLLAILSAFLCFGLANQGYAEDGYDLWLRYRPLESVAKARYEPQIGGIVAPGDSPTIRAAVDELQRGYRGMFGGNLTQQGAELRDGAVLVVRAGSPLVQGLDLPFAKLGGEGYLLRSATVQGKRVTIIAGNRDIGALYGVFRFLKLLQAGQPIDKLDIADAPKLQVRVLNHWDNLDRHVERGYAGQSIWDWQKLPRFKDPRYTDYARANASIGINGTVLTNVNANADILRPDYLQKVKALADAFRPYGIKVYLTARFSAPIELGGLATADPLDPAVRAWWKAKIDEIYAVIPISAACWSRPIRRASRARPIIIAPMPKGRTCWRMRSPRIAAS